MNSLRRIAAAMTNRQQLDDDFNNDNISHYLDKLITTYTAAP